MWMSSTTLVSLKWRGAVKSILCFARRAMHLRAPILQSTLAHFRGKSCLKTCLRAYMTSGPRNSRLTDAAHKLHLNSFPCNKMHSLYNTATPKRAPHNALLPNDPDSNKAVLSEVEIAGNYINSMCQLAGVDQIVEHAEDFFGKPLRANRRGPVVGAQVTLSFGPGKGLQHTISASGQGPSRREARHAARIALANAIASDTGVSTSISNRQEEKGLLFDPAHFILHNYKALDNLNLSCTSVFTNDSNVKVKQCQAMPELPKLTQNTSLNEFLEKPVLPTVSMANTKLPIGRLGPHIVTTIQANDVTIVSAATGSGKTTQLPQYLADALNAVVLVTQPRRVAAISVAQRVAQERVAAHSTSAAGPTVGYSVRYDSKRPLRCSRVPGTILFATVGVLLRRLQNDPHLDGVTHIILDEIHERDVGTDLLLMLLRNMLTQIKQQSTFVGTPIPKLVLMSATMSNPSKLQMYFESCGLQVGTVLDVSGTHHDVKTLFLHDVIKMLPESTEAQLDSKTRDYINSEHAVLRHSSKPSKENAFTKNDSCHVLHSSCNISHNVSQNSSSASKENRVMIQCLDSREKIFNQDNEHSVDLDKKLHETPIDLVVAVVEHIVAYGSDGAILVFLPGWEEIFKTHLALQGSKIIKNANPVPRFFLLHSSVPPNSTSEAFSPSLPGAGRKIVLATNIAESSVTIPDAVHVVDTGRHRIMRYESKHRMNVLENAWISKANVKQRQGRAGRCRPGVYYALYSSGRVSNSMETEASKDVPSLCKDGTFHADTVPEVLRLGLEEVCLAALSSGKNYASETHPQALLAQLLDPPPKEAVQSAVDELLRLGAAQVLQSNSTNLSSESGNVTANNANKLFPVQSSRIPPQFSFEAHEKNSYSSTITLTPLGRALAALPVHPALGKMLAVSAILGCLDPVLTTVASFGQRFFTHPREEDEKQLYLKAIAHPYCVSMHSDHALLHSVWAGLSGSDPALGATIPVELQAFVTHSAVRNVTDTRHNILKAMKNAGILYSSNVINRNSHNDGLVRLVLATGFYPNVAVRKQPKTSHDKPSRRFRLKNLSNVVAAQGSCGTTSITADNADNVQVTGESRLRGLSHERRFAKNSQGDAALAANNVPYVYLFEELFEASGLRMLIKMTAIDPAALVFAAKSVEISSSGTQLSIDNQIKLCANSSSLKAPHMLLTLRKSWDNVLNILLSQSLSVLANSKLTEKPCTNDQLQWLQNDFALNQDTARSIDELINAIAAFADSTSPFNRPGSKHE